MEVNFTPATQVTPPSIFAHLDALLNSTHVDMEIVSDFYQTLQSVPDEMTAGLEQRSYQIKAKKKIIEAFLEGHRRGQLIMGTGGGKTAVAMSIIAQTKGRVLWLAPSKIAVNRGIDEAKQFAPHKSWHRPSGKDFKDFDGTKDITFGTSSMFIYGEKGANGGGDEEHARNDEELTDNEAADIVRRFEQFPPDYFDMIVIDEGHRFMGKVIREIADHFTGACQLYMTATPENAKSHLDDVVPDRFDTYSSSDLIRNEGYPAPLYHPMIAEGEHLDKATVNNRILIKDGQEGEVLNMPYRYRTTLQAFETAFEKGEKVLGFLPSVNSSSNFIKNVALKQHPEWEGKIAHVDGSMKPKEIEAIERKFRSGEILGVTCNALWEESLDVKDIKHVVLANPTTSPRRIEQSIGRGCRPAKGKTHFHIWDVVSSVANLSPEQLEKTRMPVRVPELYGFEESADGMVLDGPNRGKKIMTTAPSKNGADVSEITYADFKRGELQYLEYNERIKNMAFLRDGKVAANLYRCFAKQVFNTHPLNLVLSPDLFMVREERVQIEDENTGLTFMITFKDAYHAAKLYRALDNIQEEILQDVDVLCDQVHERVVEVLGEELKFEKYRQTSDDYDAWFGALIEDHDMEGKSQDELEAFIRTTQWIHVAMGSLQENGKVGYGDMREDEVTELALWLANNKKEQEKAKGAYIRALSKFNKKIGRERGEFPVMGTNPNNLFKCEDQARDVIQDGRVGILIKERNDNLRFNPYRPTGKAYEHFIESFLAEDASKEETLKLLNISVFVLLAVNAKNAEGQIITEWADEVFVAKFAEWLMSDRSERQKASDAHWVCVSRLIREGYKFDPDVAHTPFYWNDPSPELLAAIRDGQVEETFREEQNPEPTAVHPETLEFEAYRPTKYDYGDVILNDLFGGDFPEFTAPAGAKEWLSRDVFFFAAKASYEEWENETFLSELALWLMKQPEERAKVKKVLEEMASNKENKKKWPRDLSLPSTFGRTSCTAEDEKAMRETCLPKHIQKVHMAAYPDLVDEIWQSPGAQESVYGDMLARLGKNEPQLKDYKNLYEIASKQTGLTVKGLVELADEMWDDPRVIRLRYLPFLTIAVAFMKSEGEDWRYLAEARMTDDWEISNAKDALKKCYDSSPMRRETNKVFQRLTMVRNTPSSTTWHEHPEVHAIMRELLGEAEYNRIEEPETRKIHTTVEDYQAIFREFIKEKNRKWSESRMSRKFRDSEFMTGVDKTEFRDYVYVLLAQDALRTGELDWAQHAEPLMNNSEEQAKAAEALMREMPNLDADLIGNLFGKTTNEHGRNGWRLNCKRLIKSRKETDFNESRKKWQKIRADFKAAHGVEVAEAGIVPESRETTMEDYAKAISSIMGPVIEQAEYYKEDSKNKDKINLTNDYRLNQKLRLKTFALVAAKRNPGANFRTLKREARKLFNERSERDKAKAVIRETYAQYWWPGAEKFNGGTYQDHLLNEFVAEVMSENGEMNSSLESSPELQAITLVEDYKRILRGLINRMGSKPGHYFTQNYKDGDSDYGRLRYYPFIALALKMMGPGETDWKKAVKELMGRSGERDKVTDALSQVLVEQKVKGIPRKYKLRDTICNGHGMSAALNQPEVERMVEEILAAQATEDIPEAAPEIPPGPSVEDYEQATRKALQEWNAKTGLNLLEGEHGFADWPEELRTILPGLMYRNIVEQTKGGWHPRAKWSQEVQRMSQWGAHKDVAARAIFRVVKPDASYLADTETRPQIESMIEAHADEATQKMTPGVMPEWAQRIEDWMAKV